MKNKFLRFLMTFRGVIFIFLMIISNQSYSQNKSLFEQGKSLYKVEKYQEAITSWMKILDHEKHSSELYFNLGNAHYKLNNIGPSIYYFEKALLLAPNDPDIKNNLSFAENAKVDAIDPLPKTIFYKWYHAISDLLTFDGWAYTSVFMGIVFVVCFLVYYFSYSEIIKRFFFVSSTISIFFLGMSLSMAFSTYEDAINNNPAIIFAESTDVREAPNLRSEISFMLHEGTKVQILERDVDWVLIEIANGKEGWIPLTDLKEL